MQLNLWTFIVTAIAGWMNRQQQNAINDLREENRILREKLAPHGFRAGGRGRGNQSFRRSGS